MSDNATLEHYNHILSAMMVMQVRTARALSIVLSDEYVDMDTRQHLQSSLGMSVNALAIELDRIRPGGGDALLKLYVDGIDIPGEPREPGG